MKTKKHQYFIVKSDLTTFKEGDIVMCMTRLDNYSLVVNSEFLLSLPSVFATYMVANTYLEYLDSF